MKEQAYPPKEMSDAEIDAALNKMWEPYLAELARSPHRRMVVVLGDKPNQNTPEKEQVR